MAEAEAEGYDIVFIVAIATEKFEANWERGALVLNWRVNVRVDVRSADGEFSKTVSFREVVEKKNFALAKASDTVGEVWAATRLAIELEEEIEGVVTRRLAAELNQSGVIEKGEKILAASDAPSQLAISVVFDETRAQIVNRQLDAGETGEIVVEVENQGVGPAHEVVLSFKADQPGVKMEDAKPLGDVPSGERRTVRIPVKAALDVKDGNVKVLMETREGRGYDASPVQLTIPLAGLVLPRLELLGLSLNSSPRGSLGEGDGTPSNGDILELGFIVRNTGQGDAGKVSARLETRTSGIELIQEPQELGTIPSSQARQGKFLLHLPPSFGEPVLELKLVAIDGRGDHVAKAEMVRTWPVTIRRPDIHFSYRIFDGNSPGSSGNRDGVPNNGETIEVELTPFNRGVVMATAVRLALDFSGPGVAVNMPDMEIGNLPADSSGPPQRIRLLVPRTFRGDRIILGLTIQQKDFPERIQEIVLPVAILTPDLMLDVANFSTLQQGERRQIILQVVNRGKLEAQGVGIEVGTEWYGLDILSSKKDSLGVLGPNAPAAPSHIDLYARPGAKLGTATLTVSVRQADFPPLVKKIEIPITDRPPITVAVDPAPPQASRAGTSTRPVIFFRNYMSGQIVTSERVTLTFEVQDAKGLSWVEVVQDGRKISSERTLSEPGQDLGVVVNSYSAVLALRPGKNVVTVTAVNQDGVKSEASLSLTRPAERQQIWAVVIGVSRYEDSSVRPLGFADSDAESFRRYLVNSLGVPESHISMLVNEDATRRKIVQAIGDELRIRAESNDTVFVYFAGHGASEPDRQSGDGASKYLLPHDTERTSYNSTALSIEDLERQLDRIEAGRVVVILDSCFSGAAGGRTIFEGAVRSRGPLSDDFLRRIAESGRGRFLLTASDVNEVAEERRDLGRGVFTHFLLEGLAGSADLSPFGNGDGVISVDEAYAYTSRKVREATKNQQNPQKFGHVSGELLIGKTPEKGARP